MATKTKRILPVDIQDFQKIRERGFVYVDKTARIYERLTGSGKAFFLLAITLLTAAMITAGCGGSATKVVMAPGYKKHFAINATIGVSIIDNAPQAIYYGDLKKSLGHPSNDTTVSADTLVWRYFRELLVKHLLGEVDVKEAFVAETDRDYLVTKEAVATVDESVTLEIPDLGTKIKFDGDKDASLVLFLDKIRIGTETDPYYQERAKQGFYAGIPRKLVFLAAFVLWDNRELKIISYGRVKTITPIFREEATSENWDEVARDFVRAAFEKTGFRKRDDMGKM
ncbi:MAG: AAA family ATPase [Chitinispirillales bacterium]|jgi:hypothetical protein|nr:AAA family ATPase [Chitinispirillales bacterium]